MIHLRPQTKVQSDKPVQLKNQVLRNQLLLKRIHLQQAVKSQSPILLLHLVVQLRQIFLSSTIDTTSSQSSQSIDPLAGYSDLQIEYARVWLAIRGNTFRDTSGDFELHVIHYPAGTPIAPYDAGSAVYPKDVVMLTGKYSYQGVLVYSSNHDGTITSYPVPSHWQMPADQTSYPAFIRETTQEIIDNASVVAIPTGNPNDVKQLINVIVMDN